MNKKILLIFFVFLFVVPPLFSGEPEIGLWEIQSIGMKDTVILNFQENGMISSPQDQMESAIPFDSKTQTFVFPELGLLRYQITQDKMEVFFVNIDETHPFLISFLSAFDSGFSNEVEEEFIRKFTEAMIEVLETTPFMVGYRIEE